MSRLPGELSVLVEAVIGRDTFTANQQDLKSQEDAVIGYLLRTQPKHRCNNLLKLWREFEDVALVLQEILDIEEEVAARERRKRNNATFVQEASS